MGSGEPFADAKIDGLKRLFLTGDILPCKLNTEEIEMYI